jgi:hypothetical protein
LTVTDIATGWTENQSVRNKAQVHVFAAIRRVVENLPFPIRGIDSDYADLVIMPTPPRIAVSGRESALIRSA